MSSENSTFGDVGPTLLEFESEQALEQALVDYEEGPADLADYFHLALSRKRQALPFWTFDVRAARGDGARLLS